jgi:hypothetical protein
MSTCEGALHACRVGVAVPLTLVLATKSDGSLRESHSYTASSEGGGHIGDKRAGVLRELTPHPGAPAGALTVTSPCRPCP